MSAPVSSFADWSAEAYLTDYYSRIEPEELCTLRFLVEQFRKLPRNCLALEFGIGPTLHHVLPLSPYASEIHVADLLPSNLEAVRKWQERECGAHDWAEFTRRVLIYEGNLLPTESDVHAREELTRSRAVFARPPFLVMAGLVPAIPIGQARPIRSGSPGRARR